MPGKGHNAVGGNSAAGAIPAGARETLDARMKTALASESIPQAQGKYRTEETQKFAESPGMRKNSRRSHRTTITMDHPCGRGKRCGRGRQTADSPERACRGVEKAQNHGATPLMKQRAQAGMGDTFRRAVMQTVGQAHPYAGTGKRLSPRTGTEDRPLRVGRRHSQTAWKRQHPRRAQGMPNGLVARSAWRAHRQRTTGRRVKNAP